MRSTWVSTDTSCARVLSVPETNTTPDADAYTAAIAAELRAERAATNLTYADITAATNLPEKKLIRIFKGESKIFATDLMMICSAFPGMPIQDLLERAGKRVNP